MNRLFWAGFVAAIVLLFAIPEDAWAGSIRFSCNVYATNQVDPIAFSLHQHRQIGNTSTSNTSTGDSLFNNKSTSCEKVVATNTSPLTSASWFPAEQNEPVPNAILYYRAPGNQALVENFTRGQQLLGKLTPGNSYQEVWYDCGSSPGNA